MDETTWLNLPYIMPSQAQKHVTHNEALRMLDALVLLTVASRSLTTPPAAPAEGDRHIVSASAGGAFSGHEDEVAIFVDGGWVFLAPREGWLAWCVEEYQLLVFSGGAWEQTGARAGGHQNLPRVGINASADETNRLAVSANATLLTHAGEGHQLKVNKAGAGETASLVFQTAYSGRAEMGLAGNDAFSIKVSADGEGWHGALTVDPETGAVTVAGLGLEGMTSASAAMAANNKTLGVDASGAVVQRLSSFPAFVMTGTESDTTTARDYDAQVTRGTGLYLGDTLGAIANRPPANGSWYSMGLVGSFGGWFSQFVVTDKDAFFRGGQVEDIATNTWYTITKQQELSDGYIPRYFAEQNGGWLVDSSLFQGADNVAIGTETPDASALLDLSSTAHGFLPPRMSEAERDAIAAPAEGLIVYNLTQGQPQFWNGSAWVGMAGN